MEQEDIRTFSLIAFAFLSILVFINYKPAQALEFFGKYVGSVVIFGVPINHEFVGIGLLLPALLIITKQFNYGSLLSLLGGIFLVVSDIPGLATTGVASAVLSVLIGVLYFSTFFGMSYGQTPFK